MQFEWNEQKNQLNIKKHNLSFQEASLIFDNITLTKIDERVDYKEVREISLGKVESIIIIVVVHTFRNDKIRIISARKANRDERNIYNKFIEKERLNYEKK